MNWTVHDLETLLHEMRHRRGDTTSVEVKRATGGLPDLSESLCAFANMPEGGTILLGVDEAGGNFEVVGVGDAAALEAGLVATARQAVSPSPYVTAQVLRVDGHDTLVAHIAPLRIADRPAMVGGKAYLRQSDGDYVMQEHELRMIEVAKLHADEQVDYDVQPARGRSRDDLVPELVGSYVAAVRGRDRRLRDRDDEQILRATNVLTASGQPTLAGLYALGDYPQGLYPALTVTAAVQLAGGEGNPRNLNLEDFTGPVPVLLEELMTWVERNLGTVRQYRVDGHLQEVAELPLNAVRELLANALVHRDLGPNTLGTGKGIQVRLTRRNLFIQSPGGLRGVSVGQLTSAEHARAAVNQRLYHIVKRLTISDGAAVIEGEGGGIREVFRAASDRGLPRPLLIDTGVQFKAMLWRPGANEVLREDHRQRTAHPTTHRDLDIPPSEELEGRTPGQRAVPASTSPTRHEARVLGALQGAGAMSINHLVTVTGLNIRQVRYALSRPIAEDLVVMAGGQGQKSTTYRLADGTAMESFKLQYSTCESGLQATLTPFGAGSGRSGGR